MYVTIPKTNEYGGWLFTSARDKIYLPQLSTLFLLIIYAIQNQNLVRKHKYYILYDVLHDKYNKYKTRVPYKF